MQVVHLIKWSLRKRGQRKDLRLAECFTSYDDVNGIGIHGYDEDGRRHTIAIDADTARQVSDLFTRNLRK